MSRKRAAVAALGVVAAVGAVVMTLMLGQAAAVPAAPSGPPTPPALTGLSADTTQAIVVDSPGPAATTATVSAWERRGGAWARALGPFSGHVGREGVGPSAESAARTPRGTFGITRAFGRAADPGAALPYDRVGPDDWWVSDSASPRYNTPQTCARGTCPFDEDASENLQGAGPIYDHAIVIDANTAPVRSGAGSAYFLHVDGGGPTAGCVSVPRADVVALLRWLRPASHPKITIG